MDDDRVALDPLSVGDRSIRIGPHEEGPPAPGISDFEHQTTRIRYESPGEQTGGAGVAEAHVLWECRARGPGRNGAASGQEDQAHQVRADPERSHPSLIVRLRLLCM